MRRIHYILTVLCILVILISYSFMFTLKRAPEQLSHENPLSLSYELWTEEDIVEDKVIFRNEEETELVDESIPEDPVSSAAPTILPTPTSMPEDFHEEEEPVEEVVPETDVSLVEEEVLEVVVGTMAGYGYDCYGCTSGKTGSGYDITNGNIYYEDSEFGTVGDQKYPYGTIVRIRNCSYLGEDVLAIVLDRGGNVGLDRTVQFDLVFQNEQEASLLGIEANITFEILRLGY